MYKQIHILDDDYTTAFMLRKLIEGGYQDYGVSTYEEPEEMVKSLEQTTVGPDVEQWIFLDGHHARFHSPEAVQQFCSQMTHRQALTNLVLMGKHPDRDLEGSVNDVPGVKAFLVKPVTSGRLAGLFPTS